MGYDLHVVDADGEVMQTTYDDDFYFRRNIFNMGPLREALGSIGDLVNDITMGYWPVNGTPEWPSGADEDAIEQHLRATFDERPGIPLHKLCSNDGWWVTAAECRSALDIWERAGMPDHEEFRQDWIPFLQTAAKNGGFKTY